MIRTKLVSLALLIFISSSSAWGSEFDGTKIDLILAEATEDVGPKSMQNMVRQMALVQAEAVCGEFLFCRMNPRKSLVLSCPY